MSFFLQPFLNIISEVPIAYVSHYLVEVVVAIISVIINIISICIMGGVAARCMTAAAHVSELIQGDRRDREPESREADTRET